MPPDCYPLPTIDRGTASWLSDELHPMRFIHPKCVANILPSPAPFLQLQPAKNSTRRWMHILAISCHPGPLLPQRDIPRHSLPSCFWPHSGQRQPTTSSSNSQRSAVRNSPPRLSAAPTARQMSSRQQTNEQNEAEQKPLERVPLLALTYSS